MRGTLSLVVLATGGLLGGGLRIPAATAAPQQSANSPAPGFVGAEACRDCHAKHNAAWSDTKHAKAINKLSAADRESGKCIRCHVTGTPEKIAADGANPSLPNVQCEACHGAGQTHVEAARAGNPTGGRTTPVTEEACTACHNDTSPHYKPFIFRALKSMVHPIG